MYELPVSSAEYEKQQRRAIEVMGNARPIDPWSGGRLYGYVKKKSWFDRFLDYYFDLDRYK